eukprot:COSAG01_NODE_2153_length_8291_cov_6.152832_6_plen_208_part_00
MCAILGCSGCGVVAPYNSQSVRHIHGEWIEYVVHVREGCPSFCHTYLWQFLCTWRDNVRSADQPPVEANCASKASNELKQSAPDVHAARYVTLVISVTYRAYINRIACNSHSDNKNPISGTHVDNKMCRRRPLHRVISGSICVRAGERIFVGLTQPTRKPTYFRKFLGSWHRRASAHYFYFWWRPFLGRKVGPTPPSLAKKGVTLFF